LEDVAMASATVSARYSSALDRHEVVVRRDAAGRWQVLDVNGPRMIVVETLTGHDDRLDQAEALARDYAEQQQAYRDGRRSNPLPRPQAPSARAGDRDASEVDAPTGDRHRQLPRARVRDREAGDALTERGQAHRERFPIGEARGRPSATPHDR
jgi:hypothetical protein